MTRAEPVGPREAYHRLVNVDEYPEVLPLARALAAEALEADHGACLPDDPTGPTADAGALDVALDGVRGWASRFRHPWQQAEDAVTRRQVRHWLVQYSPAALVDGCWLQGSLRVASAHTAVGARLTGLYAHQTRAFGADHGRHLVTALRDVHARLGVPLAQVSSRSLVARADLLDAAFELPVFLLAIAQHPRRWLAERLGLSLAWHFLDLAAFGPALVADACAAHGLPPLGDDLGGQAALDEGRALARAAAVAYLEAHDEPSRARARSRVWRGLTAGVSVWIRWFEAVRAAAPGGAPDLRAQMLDLLRRKAPHAHGYHGAKALGGRRIDDLLDPDLFDAPTVLDALQRSHWVKAGRSDKSALVNRLVGFGGPMLAVFSPSELETIERWIDSLPDDAARAPDDTAPVVGDVPAARCWSAADDRRPTATPSNGGSVRDLYHHLVNVELFPDVLPRAERYARDRLERAMAALHRRDRPIPTEHYDPDALERWVHRKHRAQIDSYRPPGARPEVPRAAFIESTVQLAPLILIDGGWLQGIASPPLIHTAVGRMLFHVFYEEVGAGDPAEHHANIYRDLLAAMGEEAPPVESRAFADWPRLRDASFDVPALWLSLSCFPRHFMPEILGLNLAVELAGVGGPYMEARDTLKQFGFPTLFVEVHNAADNVSSGHAAWATDTIKQYMDEVSERDGPHNLDHTWRRIWTGVCATLPQIGRVRLMAHRVRQRLFGPTDGGRVPLIFPS